MHCQGFQFDMHQATFGHIIVLEYREIVRLQLILCRYKSLPLRNAHQGGEMRYFPFIFESNGKYLAKISIHVFSSPFKIYSTFWNLVSTWSMKAKKIPVQYIIY